MTQAIHTEPSEAGNRWLVGTLGIAWAIVLALALVGFSRANILPEGPDEWSYDWRTLLFSPTAKAPSREIAVLLIDEDTLADYDYVSPIDRGFMATLLRAIDASSPKAIGLDFIYDRKSEPAKTQTLIDTIRTVKAPIVFGAIDLRIQSLRDEIKYQEDFIARTGREAGHVFFARDVNKLKIADQVVRYMGERAPAPPDRKSLAQLLAEKSGRTIVEPDTNYIAWELPPPGDDLFPTFRIPRHAPGSGADAVLPQSWRAALKGRIVLVGGAFQDRDRHLTPLSIWDGEKMPGVLIQAQILSQLLDGRAIRSLSWPHEAILLTIVALVGFAVSRRLTARRYDWLLYFVGLGALLLTGVGFFWQASVIAPSTTLFFAWTLGVTGGHYARNVLHRVRSGASLRSKA
jgi:CHASE2 domain-containing sensor protein